MAEAQSINIENEKIQKPAILINTPGKELVDPLEKLCIQLDDVSRIVTKHYLSTMQKQIDLDNPKPTLAQRTRFNRLNKLNAILIELTELTRHLNKWRTKHTNLSNDVKKILEKTIVKLNQITAKICNTWVSMTVQLDSINCVLNCQAMERKVIEYHVALEDFLETLIRMILRLQKNPEVVQLNSLPMVPDALAKIEISFPVKLSNHDKIAKEMHDKNRSDTTDQ